jgi:hypothetical protein
MTSPTGQVCARFFPAIDRNVWLTTAKRQPFYNLSGKANFEDLNSEWLELIDGSSNGENVPLGQQFVRARGMDVVVAIDASADLATSWPK